MHCQWHSKSKKGIFLFFGPNLALRLDKIKVYYGPGDVPFFIRTPLPLLMAGIRSLKHLSAPLRKWNPKGSVLSAPLQDLSEWSQFCRVLLKKKPDSEPPIGNPTKRRRYRNFWKSGLKLAFPLLNVRKSAKCRSCRFQPTWVFVWQNFPPFPTSQRWSSYELTRPGLSSVWNSELLGSLILNFSLQVLNNFFIFCSVRLLGY